MRFKNVKKTALMLAMFGMATSSNAALFDYNATGDTEFDSPAKQGWMQDNTNNGSGVLTNADGMPRLVGARYWRESSMDIFSLY